MACRLAQLLASLQPLADEPQLTGFEDDILLPLMRVTMLLRAVSLERVMHFEVVAQRNV
jgi:hypothetical protein